MLSLPRNGSGAKTCARHLWLALLVVTISACSLLPTTQSESPAPEQTPVQEGYGLQPGDVVRISVWREPELDQVALVRPDGRISFPLAGDVAAEGRTIEDVSFELAERLAVYIPSPEVTVSLQQSEGNRIYVTGRVNEPGVFLPNRPVTVMQALSLAGGLTPFANRAKIRVLRLEDGTQRSIPFNYKEVLQGKSLEQNIMLQPGDTVIVP